MSQDPERKYVMLLKLQADNWEALLSELQTLATRVALREAEKEVVFSTMGGVEAHHTYTIRVNPNQTHDGYFAEIDAFLAERKRAAAITD